MYQRIWAATVIGVFCCNASAASIDRIEPPFWWDGFRHTELQLMVYGRDIGEYDVAIDHPGVSVLRVDRTDNDNYLFVYLDIAAAAPGGFDIVFERDDSRLVRSYELLEKNPDPGHTAGFTAADAIYLITPDRFANGDPDNDTVDGYSDALNRADDYIDMICQELIPEVEEQKLAQAVDVFCDSIAFNTQQAERLFATARSINEAFEAYYNATGKQ